MFHSSLNENLEEPLAKYTLDAATLRYTVDGIAPSFRIYIFRSNDAQLFSM